MTHTEDDTFRRHQKPLLEIAKVVSDYVYDKGSGHPTLR